jgi:fumarate reductase subunit C
MIQFLAKTWAWRRRLFPRLLLLRSATCVFAVALAIVVQLHYKLSLSANSNDRPNIVFILADDQDQSVTE